MRQSVAELYTSLAQLSRVDAVAIVGAHFGEEAVVLRTLLPHVPVVAVEAGAWNFGALARNWRALVPGLRCDDEGLVAEGLRERASASDAQKRTALNRTAE